MTLADIRARWERDPIVGHWHFPRLAFHITITKDQHGEYCLIRYFTIGGEWQASCDVQSENAETVFTCLARLTDGVEV